MELVVHPRNVYLDILQDLREESEYFDEGLTEISKATRRKNGDKNNHKCTLCGIMLSTQRSLEQHMLTHTGEKSFKCSQCKFSASTNANLKVHFLTHSGEKKYKCKLCEFTTYTSGKMTKHMKSHSGRKILKCKMCDFSTL